MIDHLDLAVFTYGIDRRFTYASPGWARSLGYAPADIVGTDTASLVHPEDVEAIKAQTRQVFAGTIASASTECRLRHQDGSWREFAIRISVVRDDEGEPLYFVGAAQDVTERYEVLRRVERSEALLRATSLGSQALLSNREPNEAIQECLDAFGRNAPIDTVCACRNHPHSASEGLAFSVVAAYSREGLDRLRQMAEAQDIPWDPAFTRWREAQARSEAISGITRDLPEIEQAALALTGTRSMLAVPIEVGGAFWGTLCFHSFTEERVWSEGDADCVRTLANNIGSCIERHEAVAEGRKTSETLQALVSESPVGLVIVDHEGHPHVANRAYSEIVGVPLEKILSKDWTHHAATAPESDGVTERAFQELRDHGRSTPYEKEYVHADGTRVPILVHLVALPEESLTAAYVLDMTQQRQADAALRASEARHRSILDRCNDLIFTLTPEWQITYISPSWQARLGYDSCDMVGRNIGEIVHPDDLSTTRRYSNSLLHDERPSTFELRFQHADGSYRNHVSSGSVVRDAEGNPTSIVAVSTDITERVRHEERLMALAQELRESNEALTNARDAALAADRAKSQFLATMSHEIRTPLNGVLGMASLLLDRELDAEGRDCVGTIKASGESLLRIIDDILDFSKIEAGRLEIKIAPATVSEMFGDIASLYREQANDREIILRLNGPSDSVPKLCVDALRLRQVLVNLMDNAFKFTHEGEVELKWDLVGEGQRRTLRFAVRDTGIGIPEDRLATVFEHFTQVDSSAQRRYGGTGLGLAISRRLVELMGGRIGVTSEVDQGSRFWIEIPVDLAEHTSSAVVRSPYKRFPGLHVLLVEDNFVNVKVASRLLSNLGCEVAHAENGLVAISLAQSGAFDLILMDLQMPVCGGLEATTAIRHHEEDLGKPPIPIVALTANAMPEDRAACAEVGMNGFLSKPLTLDSLIDGLSPWTSSPKIAVAA